MKRGVWGRLRLHEKLNPRQQLGCQCRPLRTNSLQLIQANYNSPKMSTSASEPIHREFTLHRYLKHEESEDTAAIICKLTNSLIEKGMAHVTKELGFDAWSRDLSDYEPAFALIVPERVYTEETDEMCDFRDALTNYIRAIFTAHYIYVDFEWRESSADPDYPERSLYDVDQYGSRSRSVNIGHHLYMTFSNRNVGTRRPPYDPAPAAVVWRETGGCPYKWTVECDEPDSYNVNYTAHM